MWPFNRKQKDIEDLAEHLDTALKIRIGAIEGDKIGTYITNAIPIRTVGPIQIEHTHTYKPKPRPTRVWITFRNGYGEIWQGSPVPIYARKTMLYPVPLSWLTGKNTDNQQIQMELNLEYDENF